MGIYKAKCIRNVIASSVYLKAFYEYEYNTKITIENEHNSNI